MKHSVFVTSAWILVLGSALAVVWVTHQTRQATRELEKLRHEAADLHAESGQLLLEKNTFAAYSRVEQLATEKLNMIVPEIDQVIIVKP